MPQTTSYQLHNRYYLLLQNIKLILKNMKKIFIPIITIINIFCFSSCEKITGEGPVETEERAYNNFSGLYAAIPGTIYYTKSNNFKVQLKAQRNILDIIKTSVRGNELKLDYRSNTIVGKHNTIEIHVSAPSLESLHLDCSGTVRVTGNIISQNLHSQVSSSGSLIIDSVQITDVLRATVSGSGKINILSGQTASENITISGSGNANVSAVKALNTIARINGSGYTKVYPIQTLNAFISGSGDIYYLGNPIISSHISGSGKILKL